MAAKMMHTSRTSGSRLSSGEHPVAAGSGPIMQDMLYMIFLIYIPIP